MILRERFLRDEQRRDLAFRNFDAGKARDRFRIMKTEAERIVFDRQAESIAHEIDVALDCF